MLLQLIVVGVLLYTAWCYISRYIQIQQVERRVVFVTGCATGFGNKLAKRLDELGVHVYAGCLTPEFADELNGETSDRVKAFVYDVTKQDTIDNAVNFVRRDLNGEPLWAIVNNAGVPAALVPFDWTQVEEYQTVLDINFMGVVRTTLALLPFLKKGLEGRIVNVSSMNGRLNIMSNPYGISKCALEALSNGLSFELKPFNITVHTLQPSIFKTKISSPDVHQELIESSWDKLSHNMKREYGENYLKEKISSIKSFYEKNTCSDLSKVIRAFEHALFAKYPRNRYVVGWDAKFVLLPLSLLPFSIQFLLIPFMQKAAGLRDVVPQYAVKE
ncbi:unnamed protein product [Clavelina lepadiformis]|uniref:Uncharacterized protein n=1 Tax=Clavelina lepadiformis TaxID=159417 RepID=A0ABP0F409_CLALP